MARFHSSSWLNTVPAYTFPIFIHASLDGDWLLWVVFLSPLEIQLLLGIQMCLQANLSCLSERDIHSRKSRNFYSWCFPPPPLHRTSRKQLCILFPWALLSLGAVDVLDQVTLTWGLLSPVECWAASLVSTHQVPGAPSPSGSISTTRNVSRHGWGSPGWATSPLFANHFSLK